MSGAGGTHEAVVASWMEQAERVTSAQLVELFEAAIHRLVGRTQPTLGQVTVGAILDRVLFTACERFPFLAPLRIKNGTVDFDDLRKESNAIAPDELASATRFAIVEFLTVLGHLTAEILTPALHAELSTDRHTHGPTKPRARKTST